MRFEAGPAPPPPPAVNAAIGFIRPHKHSCQRTDSEPASVLHASPAIRTWQRLELYARCARDTVS